MIPSKKRRAGAATAAGAVLIAVGIAGLGAPTASVASSHREAPLIAGDPEYDNTDVYAFNTPKADDSVTVIGNWQPFEEPAGGPNFYPFATDAKFDFNVDTNQDAKTDITYTYTFQTPKTPNPAKSFTGNGTFLYNNGLVKSLESKNLLFKQIYTLTKTTFAADGKTVAGSSVVFKDARVAPSYVGKASMGSPAAYKKNLRDKAIVSAGAYRSFAGQADDPFFLDLRVFDLAYGGDLSEVGVDTLAGYNVNTIALQIPRSELNAKGNKTIGVWSTTSKKNADGKFVQVSRLGQPLVNEVVIPYQLKDAFNSINPVDDAGALSKGSDIPVLTNPELPKVLEAIYKIPAPATPRKDLVQVFLQGVPGVNLVSNTTPSEQLRLNINTRRFPDKFQKNGVIAGDRNGFPNGRRLQDDVLDSALQVLEGKLGKHPAVVDTLGDGVNRNDVSFSSVFPYVAVPHSGSAAKGAAAKNSTAAAHPTLLNGGNVSEPGNGLPVMPIGLIGLGALAMVGGVVLARRGGGALASPSAA